METRYRHLLFVCQRTRPPGHPKGSCGACGSAALIDRLRSMVAERELHGEVRVAEAGCLDLCAQGSAVVAFSEDGNASGETWYVGVKPEDAEELFDSHVVRGERLARLVRQG